MLGLLLGLLLAGAPSELSILPGTPDETRAWIRDSGIPGPTVLVLGGVHGNEVAGYRAAEEIVSWPILRGRLIVLPRANPAAIRAGKRLHPGPEPRDLNREFDLAKKEPVDEPARTLWSLVRGWRPDWVLDLHEGFDYHRQEARSVGSTVIVWPTKRGVELAEWLVARVNREIVAPDERFDLLRRPIRGSLARAAAEHLDAEAMILETTWKGPLSRRIAQHRLLVREALLRIGIVDSDLEPLLGDRARTIGAVDSRAVALLDDVGCLQVDALDEAIRATDATLRRLPLDSLSGTSLGLFDVLVVPELDRAARRAFQDASGSSAALRDFVANGGRVLSLGPQRLEGLPGDDAREGSSRVLDSVEALVAALEPPRASSDSRNARTETPAPSSPRASAAALDSVAPSAPRR